MYVVSAGQWKTPEMTGNLPLPCAYFTLNTLPDGRGIMFGGITMNSNNEKTRINDLFLLNLNHSQDEHEIVSCFVFVFVIIVV